MIYLKKATQIIQPYQFGDPYRKTTCLWIKGLPNLIPTNVVVPEPDYIFADGRHYPNWMMETLKNCKTTEERSRMRSKTFHGIAKAIAEQYSNYLEKGEK